VDAQSAHLESEQAGKTYCISMGLNRKTAVLREANNCPMGADPSETILNHSGVQARSIASR
jgi:hypothetical protein